jgi:hypothetical protein
MFNEAAAKLREVGFTIINPVEMDIQEEHDQAMASPDGAGLSNRKWGDFLARDVRVIANECDGIILLPGWHASKGARLEATTAVQLKLDLLGYEKYQGRWLIETLTAQGVMEWVRHASVVDYNDAAEGE